MTARLRRQAALVLSWLLVTTSATALAWWSVSFVTAEVADRRPLRPSDVVAASVRQVAPVPAWVYGAEPPGPPAAVPWSAPAPTAPVVTSPPAFAVVVPARISGLTEVAAPVSRRTAPALARETQLVARVSVATASLSVRAASEAVSVTATPASSSPSASAPALAVAAAAIPAKAAKPAKAASCGGRGEADRPVTTAQVVAPIGALGRERVHVVHPWAEVAADS